MVRAVDDIQEVFEFACEMSISKKSIYPGCDSISKIRQLIQKGIENEDDFVLGFFEEDVCQGVFAFCHEPADHYLELTLGFALNRAVWKDLMNYLHEYYQKYELYVICASVNETLREVLNEESGFFQNEQIEMQLHKPSFKEIKTPVHLIEEKDKEPYIAMHNKDGWWTGSRILEREDLFQVYIAEDGNEIVGYLDLHVKEKVHHVFDLLVKEGRRNKGIGRALMQKAMMESQDGLSLEVDSENEIAYGLYKSLGFKDGLRKTTVIVKC